MNKAEKSQANLPGVPNFLGVPLQSVFPRVPMHEFACSTLSTDQGSIIVSQLYHCLCQHVYVKGKRDMVGSYCRTS